MPGFNWLQQLANDVMYFLILFNLVILCFFDGIFLDFWWTQWLICSMELFLIKTHLFVLQTRSLKWGWCSRLSAYFCFMLLDVSWVLVCLAFTTPTVRDICTYAVLCSVSRSTLFHFMLSYSILPCINCCYALPLISCNAIQFGITLVQLKICCSAWTLIGSLFVLWHDRIFSVVPFNKLELNYLHLDWIICVFIVPFWQGRLDSF